MAKFMLAIADLFTSITAKGGTGSCALLCSETMTCPLCGLTIAANTAHRCEARGLRQAHHRAELPTAATPDNPKGSCSSPPSRSSRSDRRRKR